MDGRGRQLGLAKVKAIRAQLTGLAAPIEPESRVPELDQSPNESPDLPPLRADVTGEREDADVGSYSADRIAAEMGAAAERERLEQRVVQLEREVQLLRSALASILHTAAGAVDSGPMTAQREPRRPSAGSNPV